MREITDEGPPIGLFMPMIGPHDLSLLWDLVFSISSDPDTTAAGI
jgi:hypothetical protein